MTNGLIEREKLKQANLLWPLVQIWLKRQQKV
jgi:hypothetical protein